MNHYKKLLGKIDEVIFDDGGLGQTVISVLDDKGKQIDRFDECDLQALVEVYYEKESRRK